MIIDRLYEVIRQRQAADAADSYVASLCRRGDDAILKKIGEECCEVVLAAKNRDHDAEIHEIADLAFHLLVLMARHEIAPAEVRAELERRFGTSGLREKVDREAASGSGKN